MTAALAFGSARCEVQNRRRSRSDRRLFWAHTVVDQAPVSAGAKILGHLYVQLVGARRWKSIYTAREKIGAWLREDFNILGGARRHGRRGRSTGERREHLTDQSVLNREAELVAAGLFDSFGGGRAEGAAYRGRPVRGRKKFLRPSGILKQALRGLWQPRRTFERSDAGAGASDRLRSALASPLPLGSFEERTSTPKAFDNSSGGPCGEACCVANPCLVTDHRRPPGPP